MSRQTLDRVPAMCQLSLGHYMLNSDWSPAEVWHRSEAFADALITLAHRYRFDGLLVNMPGHRPDWDAEIKSLRDEHGGQRILWQDGSETWCPPDDSAHNFRRHPQTGELVRDIALRMPIDEIDIRRLIYETPHGNGGLKYPYHYPGIDSVPIQPDNPDSWIPDYEFRTIDLCVAAVGDELSVHGEIFSPFTQFMELLGYENAMMALLEQPEKCRAILQRYAEVSIEYARRMCARDIHALLVSSAFAGAGFISTRMYRKFVLPAEQAVVQRIKAEFPDVFLYVHTCGAIGDRLDLMVEAGYEGIDTLDPPPLGTVELEEAKRKLAGRAFIKGNIDSVNTLLRGEDAAVEADLCRRLEWGAPGGGYILSTACSVAPHVSPERLKQLAPLCEQCGRYDTPASIPEQIAAHRAAAADAAAAAPAAAAGGPAAAMDAGSLPQAGRGGTAC